MYRKPAPNLGKVPTPPTGDDNNDPFTSQARSRASYAPSDAAYSARSPMTYEDINNAITNMQSRYSANGEGSSPPRSNTMQHALGLSAAHSAAASQRPRSPSVSSATLLGNEQDGPTVESGEDEFVRYNARIHYTGPPTLPAIDAEEAFDWGDLDRQPAPDPFNDISEAVPLKTHAGSYTAQGYAQPPVPPVPPQPVFTSDAKDGYSRVQTPYVQYSEYGGAAQSRPASAYPSSRPTSAYSSYNSARQSQLVTPERASPYVHAQTLSSQGHQQGLPTHYNAQGELIVDHQGHSPEAYASGLDSRSRQQIRSRSVTPMGNDDYTAVDDDSVDYESVSGYDDDPEKGGYGYGQGFEPRLQYLQASSVLRPEEKTPVSAHLDMPVTTQHYGPAPVGRVKRRHNQKKRVQLTRGNLVIDLNVPTKLVLPLRREEEMLKTRYTAVTCDPDDFKKNNFILRQNEYGRTTEMFIVVTMYNEDEILFCRTLHGVMRNIGHLCTRKNSQTWGQDAWKKVVVCIVADGRKKIHPRVLDCLTALGVYQHGEFMKNMINNKPVTAHLFEYTASFGLDENLHFRYPDKGIVPTQILFCLKEKNQKKINSHRWFFNAFAPLLQPKVCVLIDVGTRPGRKSLYHLWKTFDLNSNVGGACGEIAAYKGKHWKGLLNPLVASQNFEYKISNILDKPTESLFGYISVLPGAFSAYRYIALQNNKRGIGPLASYFKGEVLHGHETDIFTSNMYLAEDRILCFELVAKENSNWVLRYVKSAVGETDVPDALPEFISQRRRWLNGSFFASVYAVAHLAQVLRSGHSVGRKVMLVFETIYNVINLIFSWFSLGNFYLFFIIVTSSLEDSSFGLSGIRFFNTIIQYVYASLVVACFLFSMGNKPRASPWKYKLTSIFFALLNIYAIVCAGILAGQAAHQGSGAYSVMLFSVIITYGVYVMSSLLALDPWHMITSFLPYVLLSPTYVNILNIYSYSNLDDISWGTKQDKDVETDLGAVIQNSQSQVDVEILAEPSDVNEMYDETLSNLRTRKPVATRTNVPIGVEEEQAKDYYANVRTNVLLTWVLSNGVLLVAILSVGDPSSTFGSGASVTRTYMTFILAFVGITNIIRFAGSTLYMLAYILMG